MVKGAFNFEETTQNTQKNLLDILKMYKRTCWAMWLIIVLKIILWLFNMPSKYFAGKFGWWMLENKRVNLKTWSKKQESQQHLGIGRILWLLSNDNGCQLRCNRSFNVAQLILCDNSSQNPWTCGIIEQNHYPYWNHPVVGQVLEGSWTVWFCLFGS